MKTALYGFLLMFGLTDISSYGQHSSPEIDQRVTALIEKMSDQKTEQQAFTDLESLGCPAVPAIIKHMDDRRKLPDPHIERINPPGAFEGLAHYGPEKIVDALALILANTTGQQFGWIYNGATDTERDQAVHDWREFLQYMNVGDCSAPGIIAGKVLDEQGQPAVGAQVCVKNEHTEAMPDCFTKTDDSGQFRVENVSMGTVVLSPSKPAEGYCGPGSDGSNPTATPQTVILTAASPRANVVLKLGPKGGMVAPMVADLVTGQPIYTFFVEATVYDAEHPYGNPVQAGLISEGSTSLCVPANTDLSLLVKASFYKAVSYPSATQPHVPATIRLRPGETVSFRVGLSPLGLSPEE
ncbi:MAG TPA: carboxypeptidase-like regulatory domain-containing protein [Terriglobales bacterium]